MEEVMAKVILGAFSNLEEADQALYELEHFGFSPQQISIVSNKNRYENRDYGASPTAEGAKDGAKTGGIIGGLAGILAGVGLVPALAGLFIAGPIVAPLGLAGVVGATVAGAVTGAVAGGLIGALVKAGVPREAAESYNRVVSEGGVLIGVTDSMINEEVRAIFAKHNAQDIQVMDMTQAEEAELTHKHARMPEPAFGETLEKPVDRTDEIV